jgi:Ser/Thr protein kinase RdoA (MazF antagonist)
MHDTSNKEDGQPKTDLNDGIASILRRWEHHTGPIRESRSLYHKGTVLAVTFQSGARYVLKEVAKGQPLDRRLARLAAEHRLLLYLADQGVPVPAPLTADDGRTYVRHPQGGAAVGTLHVMLPNSGAKRADGGEGGSTVLTWEQPEVWTNVGAAIGRLHSALAAYPDEIVSWHMALPERIREKALPAVRRRLRGAQVQALDAVFNGLTGDVCAALADLPEQHIHGDCHGSNILIDDGEVSGFIDLDHLPLAPRVYDLFYLPPDRLKWRLDEPGAPEAMLPLFPHLITGYEREHTLTPRERAALWPGMLATQLFFTQAFAEQGNQGHIDRNLRALTWIHEHRDDIRRLLERPPQHPSPPAARERSAP